MAVDATHALFLSRLADSQTGVERVAAWLKQLGYDVSLPALQMADRHENWREFADDGDLHIQARIEVKRLSVEWTGRADWPFHDRFFVCRRGAWDAAEVKPQRFFYLSRSMEHWAILPGTTFSRWWVETIYDTKLGVSQELYVCKTELVTFTDGPYA